MEGLSANGPEVNSLLAGFSASATLKHSVDEDVEARLLGGVSLAKGSAQGLHKNEYEAPNGLWLGEAVVAWQVFGPLSLEGGAVAQSSHGSALLLRSLAFPGLVQKLSLGSLSGYIDLSAEQAIPTADAVYASGVTELPTTPLLLVETLRVGMESSNHIKAELSARRFDFSHLSRVAAADGRALGNSVTGVGTAGAEFMYGFGGVEFGGSLQGEWTVGPARLRPVLSGALLTNLLAPAGKNTGTLVGVSLRTQLGDRWAFTPSLDVFSNASDASPAAYNSRDFGHNNMRGLRLGLKLEGLRSGWILDGNFTQTDVLTTTPFQSGAKVFQISIGRTYALL